MWRRIELFSLISLIFVSSWIFTRISDTSDCIDSTIVHSLDMQDNSIPACRTRRPFQYRLSGLSPREKTLKYAIEALEPLRRISAFRNAKSVRLTVDKRLDMQWLPKGHEARIEFAKLEDDFETQVAVLKSWLRQLEPSRPKDFLRQIVSRLIVGSMNPSLLNQQRVFVFENASESLADFLAADINVHIQALPPIKKLTKINELVKMYAKQQWHDDFYDEKNLRELNISLLEWVYHQEKFILGPIDVATTQMRVKESLLNIETVGLPQILIRSYIAKNKAPAPKRSQPSIAFVCGPLRAGSWNTSYETSHIVAVSVCEKDLKSIDWRPLIIGHTERFLESNPHLAFVEIHQPSLKLALRNNWIRAQDDLLDLNTYRLRRSSLGVTRERFDEASKKIEIDAAINVFVSRR